MASIFSGPARTWAKLALRSNQGKVQVHNLLYEHQKRPIVRKTIADFFNFLGPKYNFTIGVDPELDDIKSEQSVGEITGFLNSQPTPVTAYCPAIAPRAFQNRSSDVEVCRFVGEANAIRHYAVHSNVCRQVDRRPGKGSPREATDLMIRQLSINASVHYRQQLLRTASGSVGTQNRAVFLAFKSDLRPKPKRHKGISDAAWAFYQVGVLKESTGELIVRIDFDIDAHNQKRACKPSILAAGGNAAFCACDHRDGFGRTQRLGVTRIMGIPEFIFGQAQQPKVRGGEVVSILVPATSGMENSEIIVRRLRRALR